MIKQLTLATALVTILASASFAQTAPRSAQIETAIASAEAACASGAPSCTDLLQRAIGSIAAAPVPAATRIRLVASAAARVTQSLPANMASTNVATLTAGAGRLAVQVMSSILETAGPAERAAALAAVAAAIEQISTASTSKAAERPEVAAQITSDLITQIGRAPMPAAARVEALSIAAARVTDSLPASVSSAVATASITVIVQAASTTTRTIVDNAPPNEAGAVQAAVATGRTAIVTAAARQAARRPGTAAIISQLISTTAPAGQNAPSGLVPVIDIVPFPRASPT